MNTKTSDYYFYKQNKGHDYHCLNRSNKTKHSTKLQACGCDSLQGCATPVSKKSPPKRVVFFYHSPCHNHTVLCTCTMFRLLFRVRIGSRWLLAGVRISGRPFFIGVVHMGVTDYILRLFWVELSFSELPF